MVDLRDVARRSGVSVSTASRALSGSDRVSAQTAARVHAAARALGYRPNASARALRTARSRFIGLVVTNLVNASFRTIAETLQHALAEQQFQLMLSVTGGQTAAERAALHTLIEHNAAGVIVVGSDAAISGELRALAIPTVHLARRPSQPAGDSVLGDEIAGARAGTEHLLGLGHRRIAVIAGPTEVTSGQERLHGYWLAMQAAAVPIAPQLSRSVALTPQAGALAVRELMALPPRRRPSALLVTNHEAGYGVLPALRELGVNVPDDLSVVGYEDSLLARWWHPSVTVVDNCPGEMGELAARLLLARIAATRTDGAADDTGQYVEYRVGARLIERASTRRVRHRCETRKFPA